MYLCIYEQYMYTYVYMNNANIIYRATAPVT